MTRQPGKQVRPGQPDGYDPWARRDALEGKQHAHQGAPVHAAQDASSTEDAQDEQTARTHAHATAQESSDDPPAASSRAPASDPPTGDPPEQTPTPPCTYMGPTPDAPASANSELGKVPPVTGSSASSMGPTSKNFITENTESEEDYLPF